MLCNSMHTSAFVAKQPAIGSRCAFSILKLEHLYALMCVDVLRAQPIAYHILLCSSTFYFSSAML